MNVERRLHHAARELREVPITVPPLGRPRRHGGATRMLQALAAPVLFVAGGLVAIGAMQQTPTPPTQTDIVTDIGTGDVVGTVGTDDSDDGAVTDAVVDPTPTAIALVAQPVSAPSVRAELEMIAEIVGSGQPDRADADADPAAADAVTSDGGSDGAERPVAPADTTDTIGPI